MKLFLTPAFRDTVNLFADFEKPQAGKRVTFIPTASIVEEVNFYVAAAKEAFNNLGLIVDELEVSTATIEEITAKLSSNDYIYVSGGNVFFLLQELKKKGADKLIAEQVRNGKLYIGESAGSIVVAKNIEYAAAMDDPAKAPEISDYEALNLVDFYTVPHFGSFPFEAEAQAIVDEYSDKLNLITISNNEAILAQNDKTTVVKA